MSTQFVTFAGDVIPINIESASTFFIDGRLIKIPRDNHEPLWKYTIRVSYILNGPSDDESISLRQNMSYIHVNHLIYNSKYDRQTEKLYRKATK